METIYQLELNRKQNLFVFLNKKFYLNIFQLAPEITARVDFFVNPLSRVLKKLSDTALWEDVEPEI